jgi:hypothetical protein
VRLTNYGDIDEARAAAERLGEERPMAEEPTSRDLVELTRRSNKPSVVGTLMR